MFAFLQCWFHQKKISGFVILLYTTVVAFLSAPNNDIRLAYNYKKLPELVYDRSV